MSTIIRYWEIHDFCRSFGRIIPHTLADGTFTSFHCTDRYHDDSETIFFSDGQGHANATLSGILTLSGIVVEFEDKDTYLFCTQTEFDQMMEAQKREAATQAEKTPKTPLSTNPARPTGVKITRDIMDLSYKAYEKCTEYPVLINSFKLYKELQAAAKPCVEDCIFPTCPFYSDSNLLWRKQHRDDYDDFIMTIFKDVK